MRALLELAGPHRSLTQPPTPSQGLLSSPSPMLRKILEHVRPARADAPPVAHAHAALELDTQQEAAASSFPAGFTSWTAERDVDPVAARQIGLSETEISFFKEHGFLVKRGLIPAADLAPFVEEMWARAMPPCVDRNNPATFVDPGARPGWGPSEEFAAEDERVGRTNRAWPASYGPSSIIWPEIGGHPDFVAATAAHPNVLRMVQAFLGGAIKRPHRTRGQCECHSCPLLATVY